MNITALTGYIATDIELRNVGDTVVTNINLAVRDNYKKDLTHFIRVEAWGKTAELLNQYCSKGSKIGIEGSLKVDKFQDKEGNNREITKVNANRVEFLDSKGSNSDTGSNPQGSNRNNHQQQTGASNVSYGSQKSDENPFRNSAGGDDFEDDLPF